MSFTPNAIQLAVIAIQVSEFRNGALIGSSMYDIQITVINCNNNTPVISGIQSHAGGSLIDTVTIQVGQAPFSFTFASSDTDPGQTLTLTTDASGTFTGSSFSQTGTGNNVSGTFSWTPGALDLGTHLLTVFSKDNACPLNGTASAVFRIIVIPGTRIAGNIHTETGTPVKGVTVNLVGSSGGNLPTGSTGDYDYNVVPSGNYTVTPSKTNDVAVSNGISTLDILLVQRHILGNVQLNSPYKIIAADVNGSQSVSTLDVLLMRALILGNISAFPGGNLWKFVASDFVFTNPLSPFPFDSTRSYTNVTIGHTGQDFIGIKLGDVNNSWNGNIP
jgi:hypothetical protein